MDTGSFLLVGRDPKTLAEKLTEVVKNYGQKNDPNNPDLIIVQTQENSLKVEDARNLIASLSSRPLRSKVKIAAILQAEKLTTEAQNALLKTLEEPPEATVIILCATNSSTLLPTVISRCQIIYCEKTAPEQIGKEQGSALEKILEYIEKENIKEGFAWAEKAAKDRQEAKTLLQKMQILAHQKLLAGKFSAEKLKRIILSQKYLEANTNTRLTLENLFLK